MLFDRGPCVHREQRCRFASAGIDIIVEVAHDICIAVRKVDQGKRNRTAECLLGLLMQVRNCNASSERSIVGMLRSHGSCNLGGKRVELDCGHTGIHAVDDTLRDLNLRRAQ